MAFFKCAALSPTGSPVVRFRASRNWAQLSSFDATSTLCPAYHRATVLLPQLVWIGTTLDRQYELITELGNFATEDESHAISFHAYDLALEWLEAGRSIVWVQIARLRTPFDHPFGQNSDLAITLRDVSLKLEQVGLRYSSPSQQSDDHDLTQEVHDHIQLALELGQPSGRGEVHPRV